MVQTYKLCAASCKSTPFCPDAASLVAEEDCYFDVGAVNGPTLQPSLGVPSQAADQKLKKTCPTKTLQTFAIASEEDARFVDVLIT